MKLLLILAFTCISPAIFGQQMTSQEWDEQAKTNIRLLPKYGYKQKTEAQLESDREFVKQVVEKDSTHRKASDHLIDLGFKYLYRDIKTAMYRFNQAFLIDSTNTDIYWGFGAVYLTLGQYDKARQQYLEGLSIDPNNTHILTDYATYYLAQFYELQPVSEKDARRNLDSAITYLTRSYQLDPSNQNTSFKLSVCYWNKDDCINAWKFYDECLKSGGKPITEEYTRDLKNKCKRNK